MRAGCLVAVIVALAGTSALAADHFMLKEGSWLCTSPEAYDQAMVDQQQAGQVNLTELKARLLNEKLCMYIDEDTLEDTLAPFYQVIEKRDGKVKVTFTVEFYKRIEYLHRRITRAFLAGWTDADNLMPANWYK
ncbi:MAG: hypothetical protein QF926_13490 [Alphaproteobacteria bacterium]|jgi:hypothetical protein|nr:hypothetical protein [Alphaproteobacteria bacterium]MDP6517613.1 hypothetical protein [Alphaproteobacteria bacterium]